MKLIPLAYNSKQPLAGKDWHARISDDPEDHARWLNGGMNIGLPVEENGRVIVDFDRRGSGEKFIKEYPEICTVVVATRRGFHLHFSGQTNTRKFPEGDIKGNGYVVMPPSVVDRYQYRFLKKGELTPFPEHLFPQIQTVRSLTRSKIINVRSYLSKIESTQGQNGSGGLVRAASVCRDAELSEADTLLELLHWNRTAKVEPPWSDEELARVTTRVFRKGDRR